ncbi:hypothetical protein [Paenibacillus sp. BJ-4]|uniref:hypothetical protein n=1 Tax=Paenibacillus sp. BJ-4 TaxID=2878097 RepID=UPI0039A58771
MLNDYVECIAVTTNEADKEMVTKLLNVMLAANRYQIDVDNILRRFETEINLLPNSNHLLICILIK